MKTSRNAISPWPVPSLWTCRVSFTSAKQNIHPLKSTVLHIQKPSLNPPVDISHEWMLQRCQEHLGLLNFLLFSHHTPLTVCKNQQQHKDPPLWEQRRSQSPGTPDKQGASSVIPRATATLQQAHSGGFCMRTPCIYMMQGPRGLLSLTGSSLRALSCCPQLCVCEWVCACVRLCVCVKTIFSHCHLLWFLNSDGANVSTSGPQWSEARGYFWTSATTTQYSQCGSKAAISHRTVTASTSQDAVSHLKVQCHAEIPLTGVLW